MLRIRHALLSEQTFMVVYLRGVFIHNLLSILHSVCTLYSRSFRIDLLFLGMFVRKEFLDRAFPGSCLIHSKAGRKLDMRSDLYSIQHRNRVVLTVVTDHVVLWPFLSHIVDHHFAWEDKILDQNIRAISIILTGLSQRLVRKPRLPDLECMPLLPVKHLVDVYHVQIFVHP